MIVDMERSDLSKICKHNSVKISKLKFVEEHKHLYHYVSEIRGKLKKNITIEYIIFVIYFSPYTIYYLIRTIK